MNMSDQVLQIATQEFEPSWFRLDFYDCDDCNEAEDPFGSREAAILHFFGVADAQLRSPRFEAPVAGLVMLQSETCAITCDYRYENVYLTCRSWAEPALLSRFIERIAHVINPKRVGVTEWPGGAAGIHPFYRVGLLFQSAVYKETSPYQEIEIVAHPAYGRVLLLNDEVQISTCDEALYSRTMAQVGMSEDVRNVCILGGGDCGVLREVLGPSHGHVTLATMVELDPRVIEVSQAYFPETVGESLADPRADLRIGDAFAFMEKKELLYDLVIYDLSDEPIGGVSYKELIHLLKGILHEKGKLVLQCGEATAAWNRVHREGMLAALVDDFQHVEEYPIMIPSFGEEPWLIVCVSGM